MLSDELLDILAADVALASSPAFLWRRFTRRPSIDVLSQKPSHELEETLTMILAGDLAEREITLAYAILIAWLLQGPHAIERASSVPGIRRLPLARALIAARQVGTRESVKTLDRPSGLPRRVVPSDSSTSRTEAAPAQRLLVGNDWHTSSPTRHRKEPM
jgi:hypothetical protein